MANSVRGVLSQHVQKLVELEHRKENENVIALHPPLVERIVLVELLKSIIVIPMAAQVNMIFLFIHISCFGIFVLN